MADLHFLPYLRRGLVRHLSAADAGTGAVGPATVPMSVTVAGEPVGTSVQLYAPHHVVSLVPAEIVRRYPVPDAVEVEPNYFPVVEFSAPDLPWRFSPAAPGAHGRLRPWLALVIVEAEAEGVDYAVSSDGVGRLTVQAGALDQLPPIGEVWAWAHVQSLVEAPDVADAAASEPAVLRSRLVCPRRLSPDVTYRAAVVNVFKEGADQRSEPAWGTDESVTLTVYDTWTFATSAEFVNFEQLCERLVPDSDGGRLGVRTVDVSEPGIPVAWPRRRMSVELVGALADVAAIGDEAPAGTRAFADAVVPLLNDTLDRASEGETPADYDPLEDDPVVGMPFYGSWPAAVTAVPRSGWARQVNVQVDARIAAGLGAKTVRRNQESLMAAAWDQLGQVREVSDELNRGRLAAETGRSWQARLARLESGDRVAVASPLLTYVRVDGRPARQLIARSLAPAALLDRAWLRRAPRARAASASTAFLKGTRLDATAEDWAAFGYQAIAHPEGIQPLETQLAADTGAPVLTRTQIDWVTGTGLATTIGGTRLDRFVRDRVVVGEPWPTGPVSGPIGAGVPVGSQGPSLQRPPRPPRPERPPRPPRPQRPQRPGSAGRPQALGLLVRPIRIRRSRARVAAADIGLAVAALDPLAATRAALVTRMPFLADLLPAGELPAALALAPNFTDALFWDLAALDPDVIVPGLDGFANNRVRLLGVNGGFVAAYLVGANHEMAREFVWREYPVDLAGTFFQRFFDYTDPSAVDIDPIAGWLNGAALASHALNAASSTAILIRADLVRRYPDVNVFIAPQGSDGRPDYGASVQPSFEGRLASDVLVVGFPLAPEVVLGASGQPEHFVVLEERVTAPRFGLDVERAGELTTWDELAWPDFDGAAGAHIGPGPIGDLGSPVIDDVEWGRNAAHLAAAVHRRPFRRVYPAAHLMVADAGNGRPDVNTRRSRVRDAGAPARPDAPGSE